MDKTFEKRKKVIYDLICDEMYVPMKFKELAMFLQVPREQREELREVLKILETEGKIYLSKRGKYCKGEAKHLTGVYLANPRGFGFVTTEEDSRDVFISEDDRNGAFDGDRVEFVIIREPDSRRREGRIVKILSRGIVRVVGIYRKKAKQNYGFVIPDDQKFDQDIFIPDEKSKGAVDGHKVVAELTSYGEEGKKPEGKVIEILGHINDPGVDIMSIVRGYDLPVEFSEKLLNQADRVAKAVSDADMQGRRDLRNWQMVTIDGEDAKDLDDAVSLTREGENYVLGVHIADVTNYVQENSAIDREAKERGTSVYLVDRVIPMLPHRLSNGICSLNAGEDRLALSCIMTVNPKGNVIGHEIAETVIRVDERMTYTGVKKILEDHDPAETQKYRELLPMLEQMQELSQILRERRQRRGSIDFDFPEAKIVLDDKGQPVEIMPYDRNVATKIIEDFMLLANETVAEDYYWQEIPFVYRTHEAPEEDKIRTLAAFINNFGYSMHIGANEIRPKEIQKLLARAEDTPEETLICRLASIYEAGAVYAGECRAFWSGGELLYAFYVAHPEISGSSDSQDHKR